MIHKNSMLSPAAGPPRSAFVKGIVPGTFTIRALKVIASHFILATSDGTLRSAEVPRLTELGKLRGV